MAKKVVTDDILTKIISKIKGNLLGKADVDHTHDEYLAKQDVNNLATKNELAQKADTEHTHEQYVKQQDITNLATKNEVAQKADNDHTHNEYVTQENIGNLATKDDLESKVTVTTYTASFYYINAKTYETVRVEGLLATDNFVASPIFGIDEELNALIQEAWSCIDRLYCDVDGLLNVYCFSDTPNIPDSGLHIRLTVFR